jgi:hypothetical protein
MHRRVHLGGEDSHGHGGEDRGNAGEKYRVAHLELHESHARPAKSPQHAVSRAAGYPRNGQGLAAGDRADRQGECCEDNVERTHPGG